MVVPAIMGVVSVVLEILKGPSFGMVVLELVMLMVPIWIALFLGVLVGWVWRPKWVNLVGAASDGLKESSPRYSGGESYSASASSGQASSPVKVVSSEGTGDKKMCSEAPATISSCR